MMRILNAAQQAVGVVVWSILALALVFPRPAAPVLAQTDRPHVVASFSILADVAARVAGDAADVESLIPVGSDPHAYNASARDVAILSDADLVLVVGMNFEEGLLPVLEEAAGDRLRVVSGCVPVRPITGEIPEGEAAADPDLPEPCADHLAAVAAAFETDAAALTAGTLGPLTAVACVGDAHGHDEVEADGHAPEGCDPHVWTDPANVALWTLAIRDALSELDPAHAEAYAANAEAYLGELAALDQDVRALVESIPVERRRIVTNHLAWNYFAGRYGLEVVGVVLPGGGTAAEPSVQEVLALIALIEEQDIPAIFTETTVSPGLAEQVAEETGAQIVQLYTGSLSAPEDEAGTYVEFLRYNAAALAEALR